MTLQQHLELICKYLPHKVLYSHNGNVAELMPYHLGMHLKNIERGDDWKLVLRPLSDLVKPCLDGGKIPIVELTTIAKIEDGFTRITCHNNFGSFDVMAYFEGGRIDTLSYEPKFKCFEFIRHTRDLGTFDIIGGLNQLKLFEQLHQWHFFLGDQSLFGKEIIDINTLK